jgi:hypothetical protein
MSSAGPGGASAARPSAPWVRARRCRGSRRRGALLGPVSFPGSWEGEEDGLERWMDRRRTSRWRWRLGGVTRSWNGVDNIQQNRMRPREVSLHWQNYGAALQGGIRRLVRGHRHGAVCLYDARRKAQLGVPYGERDKSIMPASTHTAFIVELRAAKLVGACALAPAS